MMVQRKMWERRNPKPVVPVPVVQVVPVAVSAADVPLIIDE
jgi:hypothetical protein